MNRYAVVISLAFMMVFGTATLIYAVDMPKDTQSKDMLEKKTKQKDDSPAAGHGDNPKAVVETAPQQAVKGEIIKAEGEFYTVKDPSGKEVRIHVDKTTNLDKASGLGATLKVGDQIEVEVTPQGHARTVKAATTGSEKR
jgi:hypothetical protein